MPFIKGHTPWNKDKTGLQPKNIGMTGQHHTIKSKEKLSRIMNERAVRGYKHYNWNGGKSRWYKYGYHTRKFKEWRTAVFTRDNYTCQRCGDNKGGNLNAHHIKSFTYYPKLRFDINNGQTLCIECHKLTDTYLIKGKKR